MPKASRRSRAKASFRRHPKLLTRAVNATGALIAFNREIGSVVTDFQSGNLMANPHGSLQNLLYASVGITPDGSLNNAALQASIVSKVGGYAFVKIAKFFLRRFRM
jgi:hypothetical protein